MQPTGDKVLAVLEAKASLLVDRDAFELGGACRAFFDPEALIVIDRNEGDCLFPGFIDVPSLRHSWHDRYAIAGVFGPDMDVSKCPIIESPALEVG